MILKCPITRGRATLFGATVHSFMHRDLESAVADGETSPPKREGTSAMGPAADLCVIAERHAGLS
jgi:hypothetical protein